MFGLGLAELGVIFVVGLLVFGPDKLPELAKQAGQFVRTVRHMAANAKADLGRELGTDLSDLDLRSLDPREVIRRNILDDAPSVTKATVAKDPTSSSGDRALRPGEPAPFDPDAT